MPKSKAWVSDLLSCVTVMQMDGHGCSGTPVHNGRQGAEQEGGVCDIQHECQRSPGLNVAIDELGKDVETNLRVCDGLDDADWEAERKGDEDGEKKRPPAEVGGISENGIHAQSQHLCDGVS